MDRISFASKYAALEATVGFKPAALRELVQNHKGVEQAFDHISSEPTLYKLLDEFYEKAFKEISKLDSSYSILIKCKSDFPEKLSVWSNSSEVLYVRGNKDLLSMKGVAVVGSRAASEDGKSRANRISRILSDNSYCINSGLALGIDTAAHIGAFRAGGCTLAVIGTPINQYYPKENRELQDKIAMEGAVVSQFSPIRKTQQLNFPLRNELMSAFSLATIIVEASETSGALTQAKACLKQGRRLFIMQNQIDRTDLKWPREFLSKGAVALKSTEDLLKTLESSTPVQSNSESQMKLL